MKERETATGFYPDSAIQVENFDTIVWALTIPMFEHVCLKDEAQR